MNITAIVAEYNPFHNGHKYHIESAIKKGATHIVAVMSGNYVQRGETAIFDKWTRTEIALKNGADLVVELPTPWAVSCAENFAYGAISIIKNTGCVNSVSFGCECDDKEKLLKTADLLLSDDFSEKIKEELKKGISYPMAVEKSLKNYDESCADILSEPNNTLAVEYIKNMKKLSFEPDIIAIKRLGAKHDDDIPSDDTASATYLRNELKKGNIGDIRAFITNETYDIIKDKEIFDLSFCERAIISALRKMGKDDFINLPDVREGLENRIYNAVRESVSLDEIMEKIKSKRYPLSSIRRILLCAYLGITDEYIKTQPPYIRVLGFNEKGTQILKKMRETATLPVVMNASDIFRLGEKENRLFELESRCTDLYNLGFKTIKKCGEEMTANTIRILDKEKLV
ncbi:MAG: nucleotidyltransferase [Clostridiales bacterium]|nr:nucleotidyltransferase [Clostridiales bacterium]